MSNLPEKLPNLPPEQLAIRERCYHPTGMFKEFKKEELEQSIAARFEQQVASRPERSAVEAWDAKFSYDALNKMANQIAHGILRRCGEGEEPIALLFAQGASQIAAIIGILKTGKMYVPLDPEYPRSQTKHMLTDSQSSLMLTDHRNLTFARSLAGDSLQVMNVDEISSDAPSGNPDLPVPPDALAYILYTSGSTGSPKGVVETNRNVLHFTRDRTNACHFCADDRFSLFSSCAFSGSLTPMFNALLNGATLLPHSLKGEPNLSAWLIRERITVLIGSSEYRHLVGNLADGFTFPDIRLLFLGAMPMYATHVEAYKKHFSDSCILINSYGSTEVKSMRMNFLDKQSQLSGNNVPLGYPVDDTDVLLLDETGKEVAIGDVGEIAIQTPYMSPGYWRRPDLTDDRFRTSPNGDGDRIYLTGDLGRLLPGGCLMHMGRKDLQVKVRGYRIELGEIEAALLNTGMFDDAVVTTDEQNQENSRLIAYVVPKDRRPHDVGAIRQALEGQLPQHMIPSLYVPMDALPLNPNGKVDRKSLPKPGRARPALSNPLVSPRTPMEERLSEIWGQVLGLDQLGVSDDFLELGGDSLSAGRIIASAIESFRVEMSIRALFESPTVEDMARVITQSRATSADKESVEDMLKDLESLQN